MLVKHVSHSPRHLLYTAEWLTSVQDCYEGNAIQMLMNKLNSRVLKLKKDN